MENVNCVFGILSTCTKYHRYKQHSHHIHMNIDQQIPCVLSHKNDIVSIFKLRCVHYFAIICNSIIFYAYFYMFSHNIHMRILCSDVDVLCIFHFSLIRGNPFFIFLSSIASKVTCHCFPFPTKYSIWSWFAWNIDNCIRSVTDGPNNSEFSIILSFSLPRSFSLSHRHKNIAYNLVVCCLPFTCLVCADELWWNIVAVWWSNRNETNWFPSASPCRIELV